MSKPIEPEGFAKMKLAFARKGGVIDQSDEMQRYLDVRGAEGVTFNAKLIGLRHNPTRSTVFEEFIHTAQMRRGKDSNADILQNEVEAAKKLIKHRKAYRIPNKETRKTIKRLRNMRGRVI